MHFETEKYFNLLKLFVFQDFFISKENFKVNSKEEYLDIEIINPKTFEKAELEINLGRFVNHYTFCFRLKHTEELIDLHFKSEELLDLHFKSLNEIISIGFKRNTRQMVSFTVYL